MTSLRRQQYDSHSASNRFLFTIRELPRVAGQAAQMANAPRLDHTATSFASAWSISAR